MFCISSVFVNPKRTRRTAAAKCVKASYSPACKNCLNCQYCARDGGACGLCYNLELTLQATDPDHPTLSTKDVMIPYWKRSHK